MLGPSSRSPLPECDPTTVLPPACARRRRRRRRRRDEEEEEEQGSGRGEHIEHSRGQPEDFTKKFEGSLAQLYLMTFLILFLSRGPWVGSDCHLPKEIVDLGPIPARMPEGN